MHHQTLLVVLVVAFIECAVSTAEVNTIGDQSTRRYLKHIETGIDTEDTKTPDAKHVAENAEAEERVIMPAPVLTKLGSVLQRTNSLVKVENVLKNQPPIKVIHTSDIANMEAVLAKKPSLVKTLGKIPAKAAQEKIKSMNGFTDFILNVDIAKFIVLLTLVGIVSTGAILVGSMFAGSG